MAKRRHRLASFALVCVFSVGLAAAQEVTSGNTAPKDSDETKPLTFSLTLMGEIEDTAATKAGFHTSYFRTAHLGFSEFKASDGEKVVIHHGYFETADEARRFFDWTLEKRAAHVVRQGDKVDRHGKTVGQRAEYLLKSDSKTKTWVVMWTDGVSFSLVTAPTLECALELEKAALEPGKQ